MDKQQKKQLILKILSEEQPRVIYGKDGIPREGYKRSYNEIAADLELQLWHEKHNGIIN